MIDYSLLKIIPAQESDRQFCRTVKKAAEGKYITKIWGWDEKVEEGFHNQQWRDERPSIIVYGDKPIGTIYINQYGDSLKIGQFFILPEYQNKGIGSRILHDVLENADVAGLTTKLSYLENNPVASLYERMGFNITAKKEHFFFMERSPRRQQ